MFRSLSFAGFAYFGAWFLTSQFGPAAVEDYIVREEKTAFGRRESGPLAVRVIFLQVPFPLVAKAEWEAKVPGTPRLWQARGWFLCTPLAIYPQARELISATK